MNEEMMDYVEQERAKQREKERDLYEELHLRERELAKHRDMLRHREMELENYKNTVKEEHLEREKALRKEISERNKLIEERERDLFIRQKAIEQEFSKRFEEAEELRRTLQGELLRKESELQSLLIETEREKEKYQEESRKNLESKSKKFVSSALDLLERKEQKFHKIARNWSIAGATSIFFGICFAVLSMTNSADIYHMKSDSGIGYYIYTMFRGLIVVGLFGALARYAFVLSKSFMHESLKSGERLHAIKFGEFYIDTYGAGADWAQLKEAFEHWNINAESAFSKTPPPTDSSDVVSKTVSQALETVLEKASAKN